MKQSLYEFCIKIAMYYIGQSNFMIHVKPLIVDLNLQELV